MRSTKMSEKNGIKSMKGSMKGMNGSMNGMKWIVVLLAVFLAAGVFVGAAAAGEVHNITFSSATNGSVSYSGGTTAEAGSTVTLTIEPATGYELDTISVTKTGDSSEISTSTTFTMPDEDVTVTATFKQKEYTITVTKEGQGTAGASKNKAKFEDEITLTATPETGYKFKEWQTTPSSLSVGENNTFTMPAENVTVKAIFEEETAPQYTVTYYANGATGTAPEDSSSPYASNAEVTVLGKGDLAKTGYTFTGWNTNAAGTGTNYAVGEKFNISANTTLYAKWTA